MNFLVITSVVVALTVLVGALLAGLMVGLERVVRKESSTQQKDRENRNPAVTLGHDVPVTGDYQEQLKQARKIAARQAASTPRGGNLGIGTVGDRKQPTAIEAAKNDPVTAVKIARFHGWSGARTGVTVAATAEVAVKAPSETIAPEKSAADLVPGVDYPVIEITDDMDPAEIRKARIANAKAKSAAAKALKAAGPQTIQTAPTAVQAPVQGTEAVPAQSAPASAGTGRVPVAGVDYEVIELTDDMTPDEKRKARISNAKAKSAAMKRFKESGGSVAAAPSEPAAEVAPADAVATESNVVEVAPPSDIPKPEFVEITDDMSPDEIRKARIQNAKAKSAYNRALKAAGVDPSSVS
jgi:hypothetical protein